LEDALPTELVAEIRDYLQQQKVLGTDRFRAWVEARKKGVSPRFGHSADRRDTHIVPDTNGTDLNSSSPRKRGSSVAGSLKSLDSRLRGNDEK